MKLSGPDATRFCASPTAGRRGALIYGEDAGQVDQRRIALTSALAGPNADAEMRVAAIAASDLRADPARLDAALRSHGFFAGPRVVAVIAATDGLAPVIATALAEAAQPDAFLIVTADRLTPKSPLRKLFEEARDAVAAPCYADPPTGDAIARLVRAGGAGDVEPAAAAALELAAMAMDAGAFRRLTEVVALHAGPGASVTLADVEACLGGLTSDADAAVDAMLTGRSAAMRLALARLAAQGGAPVTLCLAAARRVRDLYGVAALDGQAGQAAAMRLRPPQRRDQLVALARRWGPARLERALRLLLETDKALRGGSAAPPVALLERTMLRLASEAPR